MNTEQYNLQRDYLIVHTRDWGAYRNGEIHVIRGTLLFRFDKDTRTIQRSVVRNHPNDLWNHKIGIDLALREFKKFDKSLKVIEEMKQSTDSTELDRYVYHATRVDMFLEKATVNITIPEDINEANWKKWFRPMAYDNANEIEKQCIMDYTNYLVLTGHVKVVIMDTDKDKFLITYKVLKDRLYK